jgi:hypothetical protein
MDDFDIGQIVTRLRRLERNAKSGISRAEGMRFGPIDMGGFTAGGRVDGRKIVAKGSPPGVTFPSFTGAVTDISITLNWSGLLQRGDGTKQAVVAASMTVNGLVPSTIYYFYPFFATLGCGVGFVAGNTGSPSFAHTAPTDAAAAQQSTQDREALSFGAIYFTTRATPGSTAVTGGGSRGDVVGGTVPGGCPRDYMVVESLSRGIVKCASLEPGERIASPDGDGWTEIVSIKLTPCDTFVLIRTDAGDEIEISPETPQPLFDGSDEPASLLTLSNRIMVRQPGGGSGYVGGLEWVDAPDGLRVVISCEPEHRFWCGRHSPMIAAHNIFKNLL